jgi:hypothetical protein
MSHLSPDQIEALARSPAEQPHLEACAQCRQSVTQARARHRLLKGLKDLTLTDAAFRRVEAKVMSEVEAPVTGWSLVRSQLRTSWVLGAVMLALVLVLAVPMLERPPPTPAVAVEQPTVPKSHSVQLLAVLIEGQVTRNGTAMVAGDSVSTLDEVDARRGRVVLLEQTGAGRVELTGAARFGGSASVALDEGTLAVDSGAEVLAEAGGVWVGGTDAAFVVTRSAAEVVVDVLRGQAFVGSDSAMRGAVKLAAFAQLKIPLPARVPFGAIGHEPAPYPFAQLPTQPWARLDVSDLSVAFSVDGQRMGGTPSSMLLPLGRHRVRTQFPGEPSRESWVNLVAGGSTSFKPEHRLVEEREAPPPSEDAIAELERALKEQIPKLRACYEKWLKANPEASGQVELNLVVGKSGKVLAARVDEATISRESIDCLIRSAKTLRLPALGSQQELQVPLVLTQTR